MLSTRIRTAVVTLIAASSLVVALAAPAASQAQWHTIVVNGHVFTHGNFTEGGVSPCTRIEGQLNGWQQAVGDYREWVGRHDAGEATAKEELANAEGEANRASGEAFEYGCDVAAAAKSSSPKPGQHAGPGRVTTADSTR